MLNIPHFRKHIVDPTLKKLDMYSPAASNLMIGTALQESLLMFLRQKGGGPGTGLYQMEPRWHREFWERYVWPRGRMADLFYPIVRVRDLSPDVMDYLDRKLETDLEYQTAIARMYYWQFPEPLPAADDISGLARYWKQYWNTERGAGRTEQFIHRYITYIVEAKQ